MSTRSSRPVSRGTAATPTPQPRTPANVPAKSSSAASQEGWSVIDKITRFTHAVGRFNDGRGSGILIALPSAQEAAAQRAAETVQRREEQRRNRGRLLRQRSGLMPRHGSNASESRQTRANALDETVNRAGLATVLTTSFVLPSRDDARRLSLNFLEQPVVGTAALLRGSPQPFSVPIKAGHGFVTSLAPASLGPPGTAAAAASPGSAGGGGASRHRRRHTGAKAAAATRQDFTARTLPSSNIILAGTPAQPPMGGFTQQSVIPYLPDDSDSGDSDAEEEIGYTLTYCALVPSPHFDEDEEGEGTSEGGSSFAHSRSADVETGRSGALKRGVDASLRLIRPLPLPLLLSSIPPVKVGDTHLCVTHVNGRERRYIVQHVIEVHPDFVVYDADENSYIDFCSGGPAFNSNGDFVGLQHFYAQQSICMLTTSLVRHLFQSDVLGMCRSPISDLPRYVVESVTGAGLAMFQESTAGGAGAGGATGDVIAGAGSSRDGAAAGALMLPNRGVQIINYDEIEIERKRKANLIIPASQKEASYEAVFNEYYDDNDFNSLLHMLYAFYYSSALTKKVLETMVRVQHHNFDSSANGPNSVGIILETIDGHPQDEELVTTALAALSKLCLQEANVASFVNVSGVVTVLEIMKEYAHEPNILQWGAYCFSLVLRPGMVDAAASVDTFVKCSGVEMAMSALRDHYAGNPHLTKWLSLALGNVVQHDANNLILLVHEDAVPLAMAALRHFSAQPFVLVDVLQLLRDMMVQSYALVWHHYEHPPPPTPPPDSPTSAAEEKRRKAASEARKAAAARFTPAYPRPSNEAADFFIRQTLLREREFLWHLLLRLALQNSQEKYSSAAAHVLDVIFDIALVLLQWGMIPDGDASSSSPAASIGSATSLGSAKTSGAQADADTGRGRVKQNAHLSRPTSGQRLSHSSNPGGGSGSDSGDRRRSNTNGAAARGGSPTSSRPGRLARPSSASPSSPPGSPMLSPGAGTSATRVEPNWANLAKAELSGAWTAAEIVDLNDRIDTITGATAVKASPPPAEDDENCTFVQRIQRDLATVRTHTARLFCLDAVLVKKAQCLVDYFDDGLGKYYPLLQILTQHVD